MATDSDAVVVGVAGSVIPINTTTPIDAALTQALSLIPPSGGDLYVLPGTAPYAFQSTVQVSQPDVTIHFAPGAVLGFGANVLALLRVIARGFRCVAAHVIHQVQDSDGGKSCFLVEDTAPGSSNDAAFESCRFDMRQMGPAIEGFSCIRAKGSSATEPRRGLLVDSTTFFMRSGVPQTDAWKPPDFLEPFGICGIRAERSAECILTNDRFDGEFVSEDIGGNCGPMVYLVDCPDSILDRNLYRHLFLIPSPTGTGPAKTSALVRLTSQAVEGHQSVLANSMVEGVASTHIFEFLDPRFVIVASSNFGRLVLDTFIGIRAAGRLATGIGGQGLVLYANNHHNFGGASAHMIQLESIRDVTVARGVLSLIKPGQVPILIGPAPCANVVIDSGQARQVE